MKSLQELLRRSAYHPPARFPAGWQTGRQPVFPPWVGAAMMGLLFFSLPLMKRRGGRREERMGEGRRINGSLSRT